MKELLELHNMRMYCIEEFVGFMWSCLFYCAFLQPKQRIQCVLKWILQLSNLFFIFLFSFLSAAMGVELVEKQN